VAVATLLLHRCWRWWWCRWWSRGGGTSPMWGDFQLTEPGQLVERVKRFLTDEDRRRTQTTAHRELLRHIGDFGAIAVVASARAHNINDPIWPWIKPVFTVFTCVQPILYIPRIYVFMHTLVKWIFILISYPPPVLRVSLMVVNKWVCMAKTNANESLRKIALWCNDKARRYRAWETLPLR